MTWRGQHRDGSDDDGFDAVWLAKHRRGELTPFGTEPSLARRFLAWMRGLD